MTLATRRSRTCPIKSPSSRDKILPCFRLFSDDLQTARGIALKDFLHQPRDGFARCKSKNGHDILPGDLLAAKGDALIQHALRVSQSSLCAARDSLSGVRLKENVFLLRNRQQMLRNGSSQGSGANQIAGTGS